MFALRVKKRPRVDAAGPTPSAEGQAQRALGTADVASCGAGVVARTATESNEVFHQFQLAAALASVCFAKRLVLMKTCGQLKFERLLSESEICEIF